MYRLYKSCTVCALRLAGDKTENFTLRTRRFDLNKKTRRRENASGDYWSRRQRTGSHQVLSRWRTWCRLLRDTKRPRRSLELHGERGTGTVKRRTVWNYYIINRPILLWLISLIQNGDTWWSTVLMLMLKKGVYSVLLSSHTIWGRLCITIVNTGVKVMQ